MTNNEAVAQAFEAAIRTMRKRVWVPFGCEAKLGEIKDGAVPVWWMRKEIERLRLIDSETPDGAAHRERMAARAKELRDWLNGGVVR